jgi:CDP-archaeol synthase
MRSLRLAHPRPSPGPIGPELSSPEPVRQRFDPPQPSTRAVLTAPQLLSILFLLGIANGSPIFARGLLKERFAIPLDGGRRLPDGQPVFGASKTVCGVIVSLGSTTILAPVLGFSWSVGASIGLGAMAGDLFSSFVKRRLRLEPHAQAFGLDQVPEALVPLLLVRDRLGLGWLEIAALLTAFVALQLVLSRLLFMLGARDRPY